MTGKLYIRDDNGHSWYFENGAMRLVLADLEGIPYDQNGYPCNSLEEGIAILNENEFITSQDDDTRPVHEGLLHFRWDGRGRKQHFDHKYSHVLDNGSPP